MIERIMTFWLKNLGTIFMHTQPCVIYDYFFIDLNALVQFIIYVLYKCLHFCVQKKTIKFSHPLHQQIVQLSFSSWDNTCSLSCDLDSYYNKIIIKLKWRKLSLKKQTNKTQQNKKNKNKTHIKTKKLFRSLNIQY